MPIWTLHQSQASLNHEGLKGKLDLARPAEGLKQLEVDGQPMSQSAILGVELEPSANESGDPYVRGCDLVATYGETSARPSRVQIYWRASGEAPRDRARFLDLQVSVQTDKLGVPTPIETVSRVAASEAWRLTNASDGTFIQLRFEDGELNIGPVDGPGCLLFRSADHHLSYVEMIHPADFHGDCLVKSSGADATLTLRHRLFPEPLEKGVILRGQIRAAWLPRDHDQSAAAALYRALLDLPPPLTT